jgi:hypothetical protein
MEAYVGSVCASEVEHLPPIRQVDPSLGAIHTIHIAWDEGLCEDRIGQFKNEQDQHQTPQRRSAV